MVFRDGGYSNYRELLDIQGNKFSRAICIVQDTSHNRITDDFVLICNTLRMSYNGLPEDLRYLIKMLVSEPNHTGAIIARLDLLPIFVDPGNWEWTAKSRAVWEPAEEIWQDFRAKWYGATESQSASLVDPKSPSLSLEPLPPSDSSLSSSIFIPKSYVMMFDTVWAQAIMSQGRHGVIITGQP